MKRGRRLTLKQRLMLAQRGYDYVFWLLESENDVEWIYRHRYTNEIRKVSKKEDKE